MNWPFRIPHKMRVAVGLASIMVVLVISNVLLRRNIRSIDESVTSIYEDRLMSATELFYVTEHLYMERMLLERYLLSGGSKDSLVIHLDEQNGRVDSLLVEFEKTYLVLNEASLLDEFRERRRRYKAIEGRILEFYHSPNPSLGISLFENEGRVVFSLMVEDLHELTSIQSKVGKELLVDSHHIVANANILSFLEVGVVLVLGLVVHVILLTTKSISQKSRKQSFHLN